MVNREWVDGIVEQIDSYIPVSRIWKNHSAAIIGVLVFAIIVFRCRAIALGPAFWAEDTNIFWQPAFDGTASFFTPYAKYLHTWPRSIALITQVFPIGAHPAVFFWSAMLVSGWAGGLIAKSDMAHSHTLALSMALLPHSEVYGSVTNIQWIVACALITMVVSRTEKLSFGAGVFIVLASLSGPFSVCAAVPAAVMAIYRRTRAAFIVAGLVGCAGLLQLYYVVTSGDTSVPVEAAGFIDSLRVFAGGTVGRLMEGENTPRIVIFLVTLGVAAFAWGTQKTHRVERLVILFFIAIIWFATMRKGGAPELIELRRTGHGDRYFFICSYAMLLYFLCAPVNRYLIGLVAMFVLGAYGNSFDKHSYHFFDWAGVAPRALAGEVLEIPANPSFWPSVRLAEQIPVAGCLPALSAGRHDVLAPGETNDWRAEQAGWSSNGVDDGIGRMVFDVDMQPGDVLNFQYSTPSDATKQHLVLVDPKGRPAAALLLSDGQTDCAVSLIVPDGVIVDELKFWDAGQDANSWSRVSNIIVEQAN